MPNLEEKKQNLIACLKELESVAVAFSGGVDSTFLLKMAHDALGDRALAVTARSHSFPKRELDEAIAFCQKEGIRHVLVESEELDIEGFSNNPVNRCYLCKTELMTHLWEVARAQGVKHVVEGSNMDDIGDYRPGLRAIEEQQVKSPLRHALLGKEDIRQLSKELGLPTWDKQSFACLASRIPYGDKINVERLRMIDRAEQLLLDMGLKQVRVRLHGNLARIETDAAGMELLIQASHRESVYKAFKEYGFSYVSLDLKGYRTGSMNETLAAGKRA
ncbi:adenine nucleotide alpha hydrolase [Betaproteobacteria bacterium]|nr:adenine nucleotide alpha hydrolase [Betaproteobacteria bacterium]